MAAATGSPIKIGFVNQGKGSLAQPEVYDGANAALKYINSDLGGVGGHVLEFDSCSDDGSPEASAQCANQFVADKVPVVIEGIDLGNTTLHPILKAAGIPFVGEESYTADDYTDGYFFGGSQVAYVLGAAQFLKTLNVKSVAILTYNEPSALTNVTHFMEPALKAAGATYKVVDVDPTAPDFTTPMATAVAGHPDAVIAFLQETDCTKMITAAYEIHYSGALVPGGCSQFLTAAPSASAAETIYSLGDLYNPQDLSQAPATSAAEVRAYVAQLHKYYPSAPVDVFTQQPFAATMNVYNLLEKLGPSDITASSFTAAIKATSNAASYMSGTYSCNGQVYPSTPAICGADVLVFKAKGGKLVQSTPQFVFGPDLFK